MAIQYSTSTDPRTIAAQQRGLITQRGDQLMQQQEDAAGNSGNLANQDQSWLNSYLQPMVEGNGGYNADQSAAIMGDTGPNAISNLGLTPDQAASNYLTPEEQASIQGNTASYGANFDPSKMSQNQDVSAGEQRGAVDTLQQGLSTAVDPNALRQSNDYLTNATNQLTNNSGEFGTVLGAEGSNVRGAIDPSAVNPSAAFNTAYSMTPQQQQDIVTGAGISAGAGYRAQEGATERASAAAGASPMGVAANKDRSEREAAAASGDAMTQARIQASNAAAQRTLTAEQLREQAGQYLTSTKTGSELAMGSQALQGTQQLGQQALNQQNLQEQNRQAAQQYLTGAQLQAATTGGEAQLANEANINAQGRQQEQFNATTGAGIAQAEDTANSNRAAAVATNRQNTGVANQNTQYNQGLTQNQLESQRATQVANQQQNVQQGAIANYTGQQQQQNTNQQNAYNRQLGIYGTQTSGTNQAAQTSVQASALPTTADKVVGAVTGLVGAAAPALGGADGDVVTQPELRTIGEDGPEWVGPVGQNPDQTGINDPAWRQYLQSVGKAVAKPGDKWSKLGSAAGTGLGTYLQHRRDRNAADPSKTNPENYGPANPAGSVTNFPRPDASADYLGDGRIVDKPTLAVIGDKGPETVVPLTHRAGAKVRPSMAFGRRKVYGEVA